MLLMNLIKKKHNDISENDIYDYLDKKNLFDKNK